ncbi:hypothetical protein LEP1GSC059_3823 [Leptospira noguchii serovar Panama str. CZ214]|uniref:Uncharacterized protein n=1 Tax=Leptospira noguchii serovar Panama str. CZ214 TaxID=1001595 RepID=T0H321_9LEPT|nr:hypothetical protein LEP1GSC059_3823 [Leptospira noguchii serovar Panama str. CZ214]
MNLFPILSFIDLFRDLKPTISFILTSLIVIIVLPLYLKWPRKEGKTEKHSSFFYHWTDLLVLILIPLFLYIKLTEEYDNYSERASIILGFILSLIFIFYIELTLRFKKVRLFYFFILACSCAALLSFFEELLEFINILSAFQTPELPNSFCQERTLNCSDK